MNILTRWNTATQLGILIGILVLMSSAAIGWATYARLNEDLVDAELSQLEREARDAAGRFDALVDNLRENVRLIAATPPPAGYFRALENGNVDPGDRKSSAEDWTDRMENIFRRFMEANPGYLQIRLLSGEPDGMELLRVERREDQIVRMPDDELQRKGQRYYFSDAVQMATSGDADGVYVSRLDLNREYGAVTYPLQPVVRAVAPVRVDGDVRGVVVINLAVDRFFATVKAISRPGREFFVVDDDGDFVEHTDPRRRFATELGHGFRADDQWHRRQGIRLPIEGVSSFVANGAADVRYAVGIAKREPKASYDNLGLGFVISDHFDTLYPQLAAVRDEVVKTSAIILVVALLLVTWSSRLFSGRLRALASNAKEVAAGNYDQVLVDDGRDEVGDLARAMTGMAASVQEKVQRLRATEDYLIESGNILEAVFQSAPIMMFTKDAEHLRFERFNKAAEEISGFGAEELLGKTDFDFFPVDEARHFTGRDRQVLAADGMVDIGDEVLTCKDGTQVLLHTRKVAIRNRTGEPVMLLGISEDVTEARRYERDLEYREKQFRSIVDTAAEGIVTIDEQGTVLTINKAATRTFGYSADEVLGHNVNLLMADPDQNRHDGYLAAYRKSGVRRIIGIAREVAGRRRDGTTFPLRLAIGEAAVDGERTFTGVLHDLTMEKDAERRLIEAVQSAEQANRAKSEFLATMSHELRTPLNAIIGYSEMLAEDAELGQPMPTMTEDLARIRDAGRHLLGLINDVLDLSKIEAGGIELDLQSFQAEDLISDVVNTIRPLVEKQGNAFEISIDEGIGEMRSDPTRIRQILVNLLGNAAKFTSRGKVRLTARRCKASGTLERQLCIEVIDTGVGIAREHLPEIFGAFSQVNASTTREFGGTGLGLAISRSYSEKLGGTISVASKLGEGSVFTVRLPVDVGAAARQGAVDRVRKAGTG